MTRLKQTKLKELILKWPKNAVYSARNLVALGYSRQLINHYEKHCWIQRIGRGAYHRAGDQADYTGGLYALQNQDNLAIHVGGVTALEYHGRAHFLSLGKSPRVILFGNSKTKLPKWFAIADWGVHVEYFATNLFKDGSVIGLTEQEFGSYSVTCSTLERAVLEVCATARTHTDFEHALRLMEGIIHSSASSIEPLLTACRSVKAKRLFLYLADHNHCPWVAKLNSKKYTLGSGPRQLIKEGNYDSKFKITVPKFMEYEKMNDPDFVPF